MENTNKHTNAYAKISSLLKSRAVRCLVSAAMLLLTLLSVSIFDKVIDAFSVQLNSWLIITACAIAGAALLVGLVVKSTNKKNGTLYLTVILLVALAVIVAIFLIGKFDVAAFNTEGIVNALFTLLFFILGYIATVIAVIAVFSLFVAILAVIGFAIYQVAAFAKALDSDNTVFGNKVQVVVIDAAEEKKENKEITETPTETKEEEIIEEVEETTEDKTEEKSEIVEETAEEETETEEE